MENFSFYAVQYTEPGSAVDLQNIGSKRFHKTHTPMLESFFVIFNFFIFFLTIFVFVFHFLKENSGRYVFLHQHLGRAASGETNVRHLIQVNSEYIKITTLTLFIFTNCSIVFRNYKTTEHLSNQWNPKHSS